MEDAPLVYVQRRRLLMAAVISMSLCQFLDTTIANVAIPHMQTSLGASPDSISWVLTSFILASAVIVPITGWLSDKIGSRNLFAGGCLLFLFASTLCGAATSLEEMVAFRLLQGAGAAVIGPMSQTILLDVNRPSQQAGAITLWAGGAMIAPVIGPYLGSVLTDSLNWRWVFYINLPVGIPAILIIWANLPTRPRMRRELDLFGFCAIALGLASLQLMLDRGQQQDWFNSWEIRIELAVALSCLWLFLVRSLTTTRPLFDRGLFRNRNLMVGLVFMAVTSLSSISLSALLPTMFQTLYGYSVTLTGLIMAPRGLGSVIALRLLGPLMKRFDARYVVSIGFALNAISTWGMTRWSLETGTVTFAFSNLLQGASAVLVFIPINLMAFATLPAAIRTEGSSLATLSRNLAGAFGISYFVTAVVTGTQRSHVAIGANVDSGSLPGAYDLGVLFGGTGDTGISVASMIDAEVTRQAAMIAYLDSFHLLAWIMTFLIPVPFLLKPAKKDEGVQGAAAAAH